MDRKSAASLIFDYDPRTWIAPNYRFVRQFPRAKRGLMRIAVLAGNTDKKRSKESL